MALSTLTSKFYEQEINNNYRVAIYCRLSRDDNSDNKAQSMSSESEKVTA